VQELFTIAFTYYPSLYHLERGVGALTRSRLKATAVKELMVDRLDLGGTQSVDAEY
jgi:hypothetical protein